MKVGTDGVLLGAWSSVPSEGNVLDAGTGTGLIALMIAQRTQYVHIDAVELDTSSAEQAQENFNNSPWKERLQVFQASYQGFTGQSKKKYKLIICNPPFFTRSLKPAGQGRQLARHDDQLSLSDLFIYGAPVLHEKGMISIIIPANKIEESIDLAKALQLHLQKMAEVRPIPGKTPVRAIMQFSNFPARLEKEDFVIEEGGRHIYSERYRQLTSPFYLEK